MKCQTCGRDDGHYIGCLASRRQAHRAAPQEALAVELCAKDDCAEPRAVSKGPRPAKYCEIHKTGSKR